MPGHPSDTEHDFEASLAREGRVHAAAQAAHDAHRDERMEAAERRRFINRLKILRFIEQDDLRRVGVNLDGPAWQRFSSNPSAFLVKADDVTQEAIFRLIQLQESRNATG